MNINDKNWTKLTTDIDKQIESLISFVKKNHTYLISKLKSNEMIECNIKDVEKVDDNLNQVNVIYGFNLKPDKISIPYKFDILLINSLSTNISFDLANDIFYLNIPSQLLDKYGFNNNNFVELKTYIHKKYNNLIQLNTKQVVEEFNIKFNETLNLIVAKVAEQGLNYFITTILPKLNSNNDDEYYFDFIKNDPIKDFHKFDVDDDGQFIHLTISLKDMEFHFAKL